MFPCRTPWGFLNRSPDNCHIFRSCCGPRSARRCLFQCRTCLSKVWYPTVNRFLIRNSLQLTKPKADAKCTLCCYRRPAIFFINSSTVKARCSPNHAMVYTENGTYTAVRRRTPHHCTRSPPEAMPLPNWGVLSAAPCTWPLYFISLKIATWLAKTYKSALCI